LENGKGQTARLKNSRIHFCSSGAERGCRRAGISRRRAGEI